MMVTLGNISYISYSENPRVNKSDVCSDVVSCSPTTQLKKCFRNMTARLANYKSKGTDEIQIQTHGTTALS